MWLTTASFVTDRWFVSAVEWNYHSVVSIAAGKIATYLLVKMRNAVFLLLFAHGMFFFRFGAVTFFLSNF